VENTALLKMVMHTDTPPYARQAAALVAGEGGVPAVPSRALSEARTPAAGEAPAPRAGEGERVRGASASKPPRASRAAREGEGRMPGEEILRSVLSTLTLAEAVIEEGRERRERRKTR